MTRRWLCVCAGVLVLLTSSTAATARKIVLLQSFERGNVVLDEFTSLLRRSMDQRTKDSLTFAEFVVNPSGFRAIPEQAMVEYLRDAFASGPPPDLVITTGGPAAAFARRNRSQLFPDSPLLYGAVDEQFLRGGTFSDRETVVAVANDPVMIVRDILQLLPDTTHIFVMMGSGELGRFWRPRFEQATEPFHRKIQFLWSDGLTYAGMLERAATLPPHSAIFFVSVDVDADGATYPTSRVLTDLHRLANAPLFGAQTAELGLGLMGGTLMAIDEASRRTADAALQILAGTLPGLITTPVQLPGPPVFDWRELQRWGVPEARLPTGSTVRFREPGLWQRFKWVIVGSASALLMQSVLIAALLVSRTKRRRAEAAERATLSSLNRRLIEAQEQERSRVARELHDDICQRMAMLAIYLQQCGEMVPESAVEARAQVKALYDEARALGSDVNGIAHRLHSSKLGVLGLAAAAAAFCEEVAARQRVAIEFVHDGVLTGLPDSVAINVFRVLQEALSNAIKHSGASHYRVRLHGTKDGVQLDVEDDGRGFDVRVAMSTSGLGLMSMQERLRLVNGEVSFESRPGAGTRVHASVPWRPEAPATPQEMPQNV